MVGGESVADPHPGVMARYREPPVTQRVHQRDQVGGQGGGVISPGGLTEGPVPRWSGAMTWKSRASAGMISRQPYQVWGQPCTSSNGGPSPPVTTCWRRSPC